ncbi:hypothetical protein BASA81_003408 [Batrachochytrium salamandrivorans]|nr:hypothetical protein BASA81_003408 [Batrachochytrium salamandrivorans]
MSSDNYTNTSNPFQGSDDELFSQFQVSQVILSLILAICLPLETVSFFTYMNKPSKSRSVALLRISLFCNGVCAAVTVSLVTSIAFSYNYALITCQVIAKCTAGCYFMGVLFAYVFLLEKAKLVGKFEIGDATYRFVFKVAHFGIAAMVPVCCALVVALTEAKLTPQGRCLQLIPVYLPWTFIAMNVPLSIALLYLFIYPIHKNVSMAGPEQARMRRVYANNAMISSLAVCLTFGLMVCYVTMHIFANAGHLDHLYTLGLLILAWDVLVLFAATRLTTVIWLPDSVAARCRAKKSSSLPAMRNKSLPTAKIIGLAVTPSNQRF